MALTLRPSTDDEVQGWLGIVSIGALIALYGTFIIANPGGYVAETARAAAERARSFLPLIVVATAAAGLVLARRGSVVPGVSTAAIATAGGLLTAAIPNAPFGLEAVVVGVPLVSAGVADATVVRPGWLIMPTLAIGLSSWLIGSRAGRWEAVLAAGPGLATGAVGMVAEAANSVAFGLGIFAAPFGVTGSLCALLPVATATRLLATPFVAGIALIVWMILGWLWFLAVLVVVGSIAFSLRFIAWERPRRRTDGSSPASAEPASSD